MQPRIRTAKLIVPLKPKEKVSKIDSILSDSGNTAVLPPPYTCGLNTTELAWVKMRKVVSEHNVIADLSAQKLLQTTNDAIGHITQEDLKSFCQYMKSLRKTILGNGWYFLRCDSTVISLSSDSDSERRRTSSGEDPD
jgi:hypothetical protein